ncbi:MAG: 23S rRNA (adenine(2503)-C(2))-methyltransferase RlmN [Anaerolineae bacterium]|jgi:23S rRNA (adenine2503-C2)-methyltransferase
MIGGSGGQMDILQFSFAELQAQMAMWGEPRFRAQQIWRWLYQQLVGTFGEMTNLPLALRERLAHGYRLTPLTPLDEQVSVDGLTHKVLFSLPDGETIESVLMAYQRRQTVCVSSQVGCPIGCPFCATGQCGLTRDLTTAEIVAQPLYFEQRLRDHDMSVTNVVLMGMGEPFLNYDAVWAAIERWNDHTGLDLGARRMTISTAGHVPGIRRMAQEPLQVGLAISLHAADDTLRNELVPLNRAYPLAELLDACREYVSLTRRRITIEYALIDQVNDSVEQAVQLADLLKGLLCHVNLIPLNPTEGSEYRPSPPARVTHFQVTLVEHQIPVTVRLGRGIEIQAGCGQLRRRYSGQGK